MKLYQPANLDEALELLGDSTVPLTPIAGGTDLLVSWPGRDTENLNLLDLSRLAELQPFRLTDTALELGGLTTYWQIIESQEVGREFPLLVQAAKSIGAVQIQARGTWAGNIANASPAADGVAAMMVYDATVVLKGREGKVEVPLSEYYTGYKQSARRPDQLITAIRIPRRTRTFEWFEKVAARSALAIAKLGAAIVQDDTGWRVVAYSVAPYIHRCPTLEQVLTAGRSFKNPEEVEQTLAPDISPIDDIRSTAHYRRRVLSRIIYFRLAERGLAG